MQKWQYRKYRALFKALNHMKNPFRFGVLITGDPSYVTYKRVFETKRHTTQTEHMKRISRETKTTYTNAITRLNIPAKKKCEMFISFRINVTFLVVLGGLLDLECIL